MLHLSPPTLTHSDQRAILRATAGNRRDLLIYSIAGPAVSLPRAQAYRSHQCLPGQPGPLPGAEVCKACESADNDGLHASERSGDVGEGAWVELLGESEAERGGSLLGHILATSLRQIVSAI
jgi:hypothetical protein